jgi:hypothetical protein
VWNGERGRETEGIKQVSSFFRKSTNVRELITVGGASEGIELKIHKAAATACCWFSKIEKFPLFTVFSK